MPSGRHSVRPPTARRAELKVWEHRRVVTGAVVIATVVRSDEQRETVGVDMGDSENEMF
jgi:transposase-like protein